MPSKWKFLVYTWIFEVHSKCILKNLTAFQTFGPILVAGPNILLMLKTFDVHSKYRNIERHSKCILTAFWLHSKYYYGIPTAFKTFWSHSRENRNGKPLQILPECPGMHLECISIAAGIYFEVFVLHSVWILGRSNHIRRPLRECSDCIRGEFIQHWRHLPTRLRAVFGQQSNRTRTAFEVHSKYSDWILTAF